MSLYELSKQAPPVQSDMVDVTRNKDGGVLRWKLRQGDRMRPIPYQGAGLAIAYVGKFEATGKQFDASADGQPLRVTLGAGQVIAGWETALRTMQWGECSMFRCRQDYAYGKDGFKGAFFCYKNEDSSIQNDDSSIENIKNADLGRPGVIPPSATLDFFVELVGWEPELR